MYLAGDLRFGGHRARVVIKNVRPGLRHALVLAQGDPNVWRVLSPRLVLQQLPGGFAILDPSLWRGMKGKG